MLQSNRQQWYNWIFTALVLIFIFQLPLQTLIAPLRYVDELFAVCIILVLFIQGAKQNFRVKVSSRLITIVVFLSLFVVCGLYGNLSHHYQPLVTALSDVFLNLKFFLAIAVGYLLFVDCKMEDIFRYVWKWVRGLAVLFFVLCLFDLVFHVFPSETRYGLRAVYLFYPVHTYLAATCIFLCAILLRLFEYYRERIFPYLCMLGFVALCTLRMKAVGAVICLFFIYFIICRKRREFGFITWLCLGALVLMVAARQFTYYFFSVGTETARAALTQISFWIARDYFPFGTGFGTFASAFSAEPYSKVYYLYHIQNVWGISKNYSSFISDTFWPMILGQTGYLGTFFYVAALLLFFAAVYKMRKYNAYSFASALIAVLYLLISSTSESAFVNAMAIPFAFLMGVQMADVRKPLKMAGEDF